MTKRKITCLCLAVLLLLPMLLSGCGKKPEKAVGSYTELEGNLCETKTVTLDGSHYELTWVKDDLRFVLRDTVSGNEFYSTPEYLDTTEPCSPLSVDYLEPNAQNLSTVDGLADSMDYYYNLDENDERLAYSVEEIDNGFRATYSFPAAQIAVAVEYILTTDGVKLNIPMDRLQENENKIYEIKLAPYFVSAENDLEESYLMVPSGGGALIQAKRSGTVKEYYEAVYGDDKSEPITLQSRIQSQVYLPVFGATTTTYRDMMDSFEGNDDVFDQKVGIIGIIEEGADCAMVYAKTGGEDATVNRYSCAYASFCIRSKEKVVYNSQGAQKSTGTRYSDTVTSAKNLTVRYIPLNDANGEDTTYVGMAKRYRQYLQEQGYLQNTVESAPSLSVNLLGGTQITESAFGVPYQTDVNTTTLAQAKEIVADLQGLIGDGNLLVSLEGFGQGGLAHTEVGGGFKLSAQVGNKTDLEALVAYAKENNITLSMDYELAQFQDAGSTIQLGQDTALCLSTLKAKIRTYQMNTGLENEKGLSWYLLTRGQLTTMMEKAIAAVKKNNVGGISIGSLANIQYSDFREEGYAAMSGFSDAVAGLLQSASKEDLTVIVSDANAYAALNADYVTQVPMKSTRFKLFSEDIPFYTLVFQGYKPLTSSSINLSANVEETYLKAVSTGMGLQFTLCNNLHESIKFDEDTAFVSSRYEDWSERIAAMVNESSALLAKIGNQPISYYYQDGDLTMTVFENGVVVYVNYSDVDMDLGDGLVIPAMSFVEG